MGSNRVFMITDSGTEALNLLLKSSQPVSRHFMCGRLFGKVRTHAVRIVLCCRKFVT